MLPQLTSFAKLKSCTFELNLRIKKLYHRNTMINIELDDNRVKAATIDKIIQDLHDAGSTKNYGLIGH